MDCPRFIPRIMHQIYLTGTPPAELQLNMEAHKRRNQNWEHRLYDENDAREFIDTYYDDEVLRSYYRISKEYPAARADLLRHLIIFEHGGVYFDIKSVFDRPLDEVIQSDDRYLLSQWPNRPGEPREGWGLHSDLAHIPGGEYLTYFIIAERGHPYSASVIEKILSNISNYRPWSAVGRTGVLRTTGPIAYTLAIHPIRDQHSHRFVTESELSCRPSIENGYDHMKAFPNKHYSLLSCPVVELSKFGTALSAAFVRLRSFKGWFS